MRPSHPIINPPGVALWQLERLGPRHESVAGDIAERFAANSRSVAWVWRQVLATIVVAAFRDIRQHKLLAIASVAVGFLLMQSFSVVIGRPIVAMMVTGSGVDAALITWPVWSVGFLASGAVIARMTRPAHPAMMLLFASVMTLVSTYDVYGLLNDVLERPMMWPRYLLFILRDVTWPLCIVAGGVWANTTASVTQLGQSCGQD
jgi:hypothetical protein